MNRQHGFAACSLVAIVITLSAAPANAEVTLPTVIGNNMVLQQGQKNPIWGWAGKGENVTVTIADQSHSAVADDDGKWVVHLDAMSVTTQPLSMKVSGSTTIELGNILVGEVWLCSGQSNMQWPVSVSNDADLERLAGGYPQIRLISVPQVASQTPSTHFEGQWEYCTPDSVNNFSAVGYFFGRQLHTTLKVPIGLIDNAWGGSAAEAWVPKEILQESGQYAELLSRWEQIEKDNEPKKVEAEYQARLAKWEADAEKAKQAGNPAPSKPRRSRNPLAGNQRPANLYWGVLNPVVPFGIKGAIWYQGESNAGRAYQYRHLFPLMIQTWRDAWKQESNEAFPFYWVQLADFRGEKTEPADSDWAELREAQTMSLSLPNTGQAVIIDIGEGRDIHPRNKQGVAMRLARWALAKDYGYDIVFQSPTYKSMEKQGNKIVLTFDSVGQGLYTFDVNQPRGFTIAGEDKKFVNATAKVVGKDTIEVSSDQIAAPVSVRYAWSDNPICNVQSRDGLPLTPFRTDDWPGITISNK